MKKIIKLTESDLYRIIKRVISEQDPPIVQPRNRLMNIDWYVAKIKSIVDGLMTQFNLKSMWYLQDYFGSRPGDKPTYERFCQLLGEIISPTSSSKDQIKLGDDFFMGAAFLEPKMAQNNSSSYIKKMIQNLYGGASGGFQKAAKLLRDEIKKNKNTAPPENQI